MKPSFNKDEFRQISDKEIDQLKKNNNLSEDWNTLFVSNVFDPSMIRNCHFSGENFIAALNDFFRKYTSCGGII